MQKAYHEIKTEPEHQQLFSEHQERIRDHHKVEAGELTLVKVEARLVEQEGEEGVYYRMTFQTPDCNTHSLKIEKRKV